MGCDYSVSYKICIIVGSLNTEIIKVATEVAIG